MPVYNYTTLDDPSGVGQTNATGINASGQIVGWYFTAGPVRHGFVYSGGSYTALDDPSAGSMVGQGTLANGINATGQIVGSYTNNSGSHGFLYSGGTYTTLDDPSATNGTQASGINDSGQIVGFYNDASGSHGFLYSGGTYTALGDDPSADPGTTAAYGINDAGLIVGSYAKASGQTAFLYDPNGGTWTTLDDPLAGPIGTITTGITVATGINASGQIVGYYYDSNFGGH